MTRVERGALQFAVVLSIIMVLLVTGWLAIRQMASEAGRELRSVASENGSCVLKTYTRRYSAAGVAGGIASLFGSSYYYRVYSREGALLETSEWTFWEREFGDMDAHWINRTAMYPGQDGWAGWGLPQCD
ncbi:hypothetical protein [Pseudomonas sp. NPDC089406]|uniref:hypothetical protein n=1 Tax=Pseudomonas sp. NPDC089406 TaxID=3364463 RepID=UPI00384BA69B